MVQLQETFPGRFKGLCDYLEWRRRFRCLDVRSGHSGWSVSISFGDKECTEDGEQNALTQTCALMHCCGRQEAWRFHPSKSEEETFGRAIAPRSIRVHLLPLHHAARKSGKVGFGSGKRNLSSWGRQVLALPLF